jgi:GH24 family phage-related lysozyme (muramidase)
MRKLVLVLVLLFTLVLTAAAQPARSSMGSFPLPKIVGMHGKTLKPIQRHVRVPRLAVRLIAPDEPAEHLSDAGRNFIKRIEGFRPTPYRDARGWAVGYGMHEWLGDHVSPSYPKFQVSKYEADLEFDDQIVRYETLVSDSISEPLPQPAFDALVSVAYNLGRVNTRIIDKVNDRRSVTPRDFLSTATVNRRPSYVLEVRRLQEFAVFASLNTDEVFSPETSHGTQRQARSHVAPPAQHSRPKRQTLDGNHRTGTHPVHSRRRPA